MRKENARPDDAFARYAEPEKIKVYKELLTSYFPDISLIDFLEIGAGGGVNVQHFKNMGVKPEHITANELLDDRVEALQKNHADIKVVAGNALEMDENKKFDLIFQSTVFTSILDDKVKRDLAQKMIRLLKPGGYILWYDFVYNNPNNKDVKGIPVAEIRKLFPGHKIMEKRKVTLAPPIARRVGRGYRFFNLFPFLRTHVIVLIS